jgi:hypothetical protein
MNDLDFNDAGNQRTFDVIPDNTLLPVQIAINHGNAGADGVLTLAGDGKSEHLNITFSVLDGPYKKRKVFARLTVRGTTSGHAEAADITRRTIKAMLESARGFKPSDTSDAAKAARSISGYGALDGLCCWIRAGVVPPSGQYKAKNEIKEIVTPDHKDWKQLDQLPPPAAAPPQAPAPAAASIARPQWANG